MGKRYYFITGTSSGIGKALTEAVLNRGDVVYGISRRQVHSHSNYHAVGMNMSNNDEVAGFQFPDLNDADEIVLINNAGQIGDIKPVGRMYSQAIADLFQVNVTSLAILTNNFVEKYETYTTKKSVLNVSSGAGKNAIDGWSTYCASKAAVDLFSQTAFEEQKNIENPVEIRSVAPGVVDTAMQGEIRDSNVGDFSRHAHFVALKENNELTSPVEVATKYLFILDHLENFPNCIFSLRDLA